MARLPMPGGDVGQWGNILNNYLLQEHNVDGTHKAAKILNAPATDGNVLVSNSAMTSGIDWKLLGGADVGLGNVTNDAQLKLADLDTDSALAAASDSKIPSQNAVKTYVDSRAVPKTTTVNGHALAGNVVVTSADVGLGSTDIPTFGGAVVNGGAVINVASGDTLVLAGTGTNNTILRLKDDATERGALYTLNGGSDVTLRSQADLLLTAANGSTPVNTRFNSIGMGVLATPTHTLTLGSNATGMVMYNTSDQTTNYERARHYWSGNTYTIAVENGGSGVVRGIKIGTSSTQKIGFFNATPVVQPVLATGAGRTADDIITTLQSLGLCRQS